MFNILLFNLLFMVSFTVDLLQVFDRNALITFPLAPLLTAVLALIGMMAFSYLYYIVQ